MCSSDLVKGDWEAWLHFFFTGVRDTAEQAVATARRLLDLFTRDRAQIQTLGRASGSAWRVHQALQSSPILSIARLSEKTGLSVVTCGGIVRQLESLGMVHELTGGKYGRLYSYQQYLDILSEGTAPL